MMTGGRGVAAAATGADCSIATFLAAIFSAILFFFSSSSCNNKVRGKKCSNDAKTQAQLTVEVGAAGVAAAAAAAAAAGDAGVVTVGTEEGARLGNCLIVVL